jgi:hypothetical protein
MNFLGGGGICWIEGNELGFTLHGVWGAVGSDGAIRVALSDLFLRRRGNADMSGGREGGEGLCVCK